MSHNAITSADRAEAYGLPASPTTAAATALVDVHGVMALAGPLGRDLVLRLISDDPRFPRPALGGKGPGSRRVWSRRKVAAYFEVLAEEGEHATA